MRREESACVFTVSMTGRTDDGRRSNFKATSTLPGSGAELCRSLRHPVSQLNSLEGYICDRVQAQSFLPPLPFMTVGFVHWKRTSSGHGLPRARWRTRHKNRTFSRCWLCPMTRTSSFPLWVKENSKNCLSPSGTHNSSSGPL